MPNNGFEKKLILNQWVFSLLGVERLEELQAWLKDPALEGFDEENISHFFAILSTHLSNRGSIQPDDLLRYDNNIVRHWQRITERRNLEEGRTLFPKYFQYLALLFTEIYLDHNFRDPEQLWVEINQTIDTYNQQANQQERVEAFSQRELNKLAFWMATGSGKTLLMHCNLLQYQHYLQKHNQTKGVNRTLLLTPYEGLSQQHLKEFNRSNIPAEIFSKQSLGGMFNNQSLIEIIDIHKLADENGDKTVDVAAFEGNNLVMVDEGHSGASGTTWMRRREALCEDGFSFEYSATFGQAVKNDANLTQVYAKSILFDYSYRYFYYDGYGKEYRILNLKDDSDETQRFRYLAASLLAFYQQQKIYQQEHGHIRSYLIEKPLWVFVGGSVKAVYIRNRRKVSDVVDVLLFLAEFAGADNKAAMISLLDAFLNGQAGLLDEQGHDTFRDSFDYLASSGQTAEETYQDILHLLFNAPSPGKLHVENLKGSDGEIGLRFGDNDYFGLINVGDASALAQLCEDYPELIVTEEPFSGSIFQELDQTESNINILIGSRKFMEGWNSWRVSTMGLMNIGRGEGIQIIQLFGRGVRLKGEGFSLQRSAAIQGSQAPRYVPKLETLNIFGVRADYMQQFRDFLDAEGVPPDQNKIEFIMPVIKNLGKQKLKIVRVRDGVDFKLDVCLELDVPPDAIKRRPVTINWYPKIQSIASINGDQGGINLNQGKLTEKHLAFLDYTNLYFELSQFKNERGWHNLTISPDALPRLLADPSWYVLYIPPEELEFSNFGKVQRWQEIASALLKKYCDRIYKHEKAKYEADKLEYRELTEDDPNFFEEYQIYYEQSRQDILEKLEEIKAAVENGDLRDIEYQHINSLMFGNHLYQPLLYLGEGTGIEVKPVALNQGEREFVEDLKLYYENTPEFFERKELYLLRNRSRGHGIGFFEAGNFYPDFIMWLVDGDTQHVTFIDPKGIGRVGIEDPKIKFFETIKALEKDLGDKDVQLHSFIISNTPLHQIPIQIENMSQADWEAKNVLFQVEDKASYVRLLFPKIISSSPS